MRKITKPKNTKMTQEFLNQCKKNLIDLTARNALINFKFNSGYTYHERRFGEAYNSFEVAVKKPQSNETESQERLKKLKKIHTKQEEIKSEKGFNPTAFAFGFFKYKDNDQERFAPIYLVPAIVEKDGRGGFKASLENGFQDAKFNFAIREKFKEFDVNLTCELTDVLETSQEEVSFEILRQKTREITEFLQNNPVGITVEINIALSVFNSAKASLYNEMVKYGSDMLNHDLLKNFLRSGNTLLQYFGQSECPSETDKNPSQKFYSPFDFDSSQLQAIKAAKDGKNFIIQGPPGTGKSQTISNIIAELVADGKKVLFVAEKKAAIEAVLKNFSKIGLEKIFLDLHDKKSKSKDIRDQIVESLEFFQNQGGRTTRTEDFFSKLDQSKSQITKRTEVLHAKTVLGKTAFELIGDLYNLQNFENLNCQFNSEITAENFEKITKILDEIQDHQHIYFDDLNPYLRSYFKKSVDANPEILEKNFLILEDDLELIFKQESELKNSEKQAAMAKNELKTFAEFGFLNRLKKIFETTKLRINLSKIEGRIKAIKLKILEANIQKEKTLFEIENYFEIPAETKGDNQLLEQEISLRRSHLPKLAETLKYKDLKRQLENLGCADFWQKICSNKIEKRKILDVFKKNFYLSALDQIAAKNDFISNTKDFSALVEDFKKDDKGLIDLNATRLAQKIKSKNAHLDENYEVLQLKIRQRFGKPRKLISKFKETILDAINCVVCSPLTICEFFEINDDLSPMFDTVIFDEASQIYTWDAISSIFRAKQLIIAGDTKQMPPSNLFSSFGGIDDEEEFDEDSDEQNVNDTSSLLDFASTKMKELLLNWHYRSKFEELILPSNRFIYNDKLVTFPNSAKQEKPIEFIHLEGGIWEKQTNDLEAKKTIELLQNLYYSGKKSVGVIAINAKQCKLIRDLVEMDEDLYGWLDTKDENGLFIKNLQNCQGDERDTIIICTSYARDKDGKISNRMFGQLNKDNAEKRLNVMFSRAREKVFLLSSLKSEQISNPSQHKAIEFLKKYLTYAESGATAEGWKISANQNFQTNSDNFDSGFEESVCKALRNIGLKVESQVGCSGYKIDLAIICPKTQNYILGIECDGEIYHSGKTARERDRLRQEVLENKGWKIHRIWGYDWLENQNEQIEKIKKLVNL